MKVNALFRLAVVLALYASWSVDIRAESERAVIKRAVVESSTIASVGYLRKGGVMELEFRSGAIYRYSGVPREVFMAFNQAQSKGRFFGLEIRGKYSFEKINGARR